LALFGTVRDAVMQIGVAAEFVNNVVTQQIGYYKVVLPDTQPNMYGEALVKQYIGPVLLNCLIVRGDFTMITDNNFGPDSRREVDFRFLKQDLEYANVVPETGDIVMYNELYYEVDNTNENQLFLGKTPQYAYSEGLNNFGASFSIILNTHLTSPERLGITQQRL
jgi:hypothetical protein